MVHSYVQVENSPSSRLCFRDGKTEGGELPHRLIRMGMRTKYLLEVTRQIRIK